MINAKVLDYSCRFLPDKKRVVYAISRPHNNHMHMSEYLSMPFYNRSTLDSSNALVAFESPHVAQTLACTYGTKEVVIQHNVNEFIDYSAMVKLPVIIIINMYCNIDEKNKPDNIHYEIYYHDVRRDSTIKKYIDKLTEN